ncbi:MAG: cytochrome-c peroxidase [Bacteroidetes bacterium]|nr:cytochrome-c peroxidase [Bacteroidota bacterium]
MSTIRIYIFSLLLLGLTFAVSCNKEPTPPTDLHPVSLTYPKYIPPPNLSADNPLTEEGIALGRKLYYDPILSNNGKSCSSCHPQQSGFTDSIFNALPHVNLAWNKYFLWNGKVKGSLEDIMDFEVREFFSTDVSKLNAEPTYPDLFRKVFNAKTIKEEHIIKALSQFMATHVSMDSKVDKYLKRNGC